MCSGGAPAALLWWPRPAHRAQRTAGHRYRWGRRRAAQPPPQTVRRRCSSCRGACWAGGGLICAHCAERPAVQACGEGLWLGSGQRSVRRRRRHPQAAAAALAGAGRRGPATHQTVIETQQGSRLLAWALRKSRHKAEPCKAGFVHCCLPRQQQWIQRQGRSAACGADACRLPTPSGSARCRPPVVPAPQRMHRLHLTVSSRYSRSSGYKMASTSVHSAQRCPHTLPSPP